MNDTQTIPESVLPRMVQGASGSWRKQDFPNEAREAWEKRKFSEYFDLMEEACRQDPANSELLMDLGRAYLLRYHYASAERCIENAVRVAPRKGDALVVAGTRCQFVRYEMARNYFERAI